ncbi:MAG: EF-P lysine aminoacylase GenX [Gammaproteobacteria bacterium]|nr:EF-P lysine aminoacylase GenX [Gammaproteobacteria bacterium]
MRARLLRTVREFFADREVLEVQTATLAAHAVTDTSIESLRVADGAFLQTSPEYQLKRLLAAGAPSIYQMGPVFRAGEAGRLHNPEFTLLEWYRLGFDEVMLMAEVAELVDLVLGPQPVRILTYRELVGTLTGDRDVLDLACADALAKLGGGRVFVTGYPAEQAALARLDSTNPAVAARFELVVDGVEIANGYHELGDAAELRHRFLDDCAVRLRRGHFCPEIDERFLAAMEAGLPDCAGVALGIDRLLMLKMGASSLADVMPFPGDSA